MSHSYQNYDTHVCHGDDMGARMGQPQQNRMYPTPLLQASIFHPAIWGLGKWDKVAKGEVPPPTPKYRWMHFGTFKTLQAIVTKEGKNVASYFIIDIIISLNRIAYEN